MSVSSSDDGEGMFGAMFLPDDEDIQDTFEFKYAIPPTSSLPETEGAAATNTEEASGSPGGSWSKVCITLEGLEQEYGQVSRRTGFTLWDASSVLASWIVRTEKQGGGLNYIRGKHVVEIGCGLGLCGILASYLSPRSVTITDGDSQVCQKAQANATKNGCVAPVQQLRWGSGVEEFMKQALKDASGGQGHFDTVFGADIIYDQNILDVLFSTVQLLLGGPLQTPMSGNEKTNAEQHSGQQQCRAPGIFVVGYRRRTVPQPLIFETAEKYGFSCSDVENAGELFVFSQVPCGCQNTELAN